MEKRLFSYLFSLVLSSFIVELYVRSRTTVPQMTPEEEKKEALEEVNRILQPTAVVYARIQQQFVEALGRAWSNEAYKGATFTPRKLSDLQGSDERKGA